MGEKDDKGRPMASPGLINSWIKGREPIPPELRDKINQWIKSPGTEFPFTDGEYDAFMATRPPFSAERSAITHSLVNNALDELGGLPIGTTTWREARKGDRVAKEILKKQNSGRKQPGSQ